MPVSAKFYKRLIDRISTIIVALSLPDSAQIENETLTLIRHYLTSGNIENTCADIARIIFLTLRAEIDAAIERSRRARAAAARRRQSLQDAGSLRESQFNAAFLHQSQFDEASRKAAKTAKEIENQANGLENTPPVNNAPASPTAPSESSELSELSESSELSELSELPAPNNLSAPSAPLREAPLSTPSREAHTRFGLKFRPANKVRRNSRVKYRKR